MLGTTETQSKDLNLVGKSLFLSSFISLLVLFGVAAQPACPQNDSGNVKKGLIASFWSASPEGSRGLFESLREAESTVQALYELLEKGPEYSSDCLLYTSPSPRDRG